MHGTSPSLKTTRHPGVPCCLAYGRYETDFSHIMWRATCGHACAASRMGRIQLLGLSSFACTFKSRALLF
jgi:hypothetical protein